MIWEQTLAENAWKVDEGLYRILLPLPWAVPFVNVYVVESQGRHMLIDCGLNWGPSLRALGRALKAVGVQSRGLDTLLLTHRHHDHAAAAGPVRQRWGGRVLIHPADMGRSFPQPEEMVAWALANGMEEELARKLAVRREPADTLPEDAEPLATERPLIFGDLRFHVIHVPGHCPGQVMLYEPARGWLFAADQVLNTLAPNVWYDAGTQGDPLGQYLESLKRTAEVPAELILPGHGAPMRGGLRENVEAMLQYQYAFIERVLAQVGERPDSSWAIAARTDRMAMVDPREAGSVMAEVVAALVHLEGEGRAVRTAGGRWTVPKRREAM